MERDPIVEEVRRAREQLLDEAGGDLDRLVDMLRQSQAESKRPVVSRPPKKVDANSNAAA